MIGNLSTRKNPPETFATCRIYNSCGSRIRRLQLRPYFGHFSGMWVTFDVRESAGNHRIKVKIRECQESASIHLRASQPSIDFTKSATRVMIKDLCLQYLHATKPPHLEVKHNPKSLNFLCEKIIVLNLNKLNPSVLPAVSFSHLNPSTFRTQDVILKIWFGSSSYPIRIERMKVRQGLSVAELKWMLCSKIAVQIEPSKLDIYKYKSMEKLSENSYLEPDQVNFHCVVLPPFHRDSIIVSLVGQDIEEIKVEPHDMTLSQFQNRIKEKFGLRSSSFIFIPQAFQSQSVSKCNQIAMSAVLDKSTLSLIDRKQRNLPIVDSTPLALLKYEQLDMCKLKLSELNLFSSNLVCIYEVTGPTIPISYRTSTSVGNGEYSLISDRLHAVSINLSWSIQTLLKYIEDISHFPCEDISYRGSIIPHSSNLHQCFANNHWKIRSTHQQIEFIEGAPKVVG